MNPFSLRKINTEVSYELFTYVTRGLNIPHHFISLRKQREIDTEHTKPLQESFLWCLNSIINKFGNVVKVTFKRHELQLLYLFFKIYLNAISKMEIMSEVKTHICHLKLDILGWQIIYYEQKQTFMSILTDIFLLIFFFSFCPYKASVIRCSSAEFMAVFLLWGRIKQIQGVNEFDLYFHKEKVNMTKYVTCLIIKNQRHEVTSKINLFIFATKPLFFQTYIYSCE